MKIDDLVLVKS